MAKLRGHHYTAKDLSDAYKDGRSGCKQSIRNLIEESEFTNILRQNKSVNDIQDEIKEFMKKTLGL